jgi:hypothetical protein
MMWPIEPSRPMPLLSEKMTPELLSALQEAEYEIWARGDAFVPRVRTWPSAESYAEGWRLHRLGLIDLPVRVATDLGSRMPPEAVAELADVAQARLALPDLAELAVCGSHSPISLRLPTRVSDVDFVCFVPLARLWADPDYWVRWLAEAQGPVAADLSRRADREVSIGLLASEFKVLPGMADHWPVTRLDENFDAARPSAEITTRMRAFLDGAPAVQRDLREIVRCAYGRYRRANRPVLYVGPRWLDVTFFLTNTDRVSDLAR